MFAGSVSLQFAAAHAVEQAAALAQVFTSTVFVGIIIDIMNTLVTVVVVAIAIVIVITIITDHHLQAQECMAKHQHRALG